MNFFTSGRSIVLASYPKLWTYTGFLFLFGALVAIKNGGTLLPGFWLYLAWFFAGANLFGMLLNDYFDRELDVHNPRKIQQQLSVAEHIAGIAAALASYCVLAVFFPNLYTATWVAVAVAANILYSAPPLRLKERPPFDVLGGPASYLTAVCAGYALAAGGWPDPIAAAAGLLFFSGIDLGFKTLDIEADARGGIRTSAIVLDRERSLIAASGMLLMAGVLVSYYHPAYLLGVFPYIGILAMLRGAQNNLKKRALDARLPAYYFAAGFVVTTAFWFI